MNLITTMIVEDEHFILEDLLTIIDWEDSGFQIVATAFNGTQGLKKYEQYRPQLILTDIKMPDINGLDMIRNIKYQNPSAKFIIISAYSDFEYAKDAIRLGAEDYILKSEISAKYIKEKLEHIKSSMLSNQELLTQSLQKVIFDLIQNKEEPSMAAIETLFMTPYLEVIKNSFSEITSFMIGNIKDKYAQHGLTERFQTPSIKNIPELKTWFYDELSTLHQMIYLIYQNNYSVTLINAMEYVNKNYSNPDLVIQDIAEAVNFSVSRLCVLFKKELNKTVNEVITEKRIEEAKKLLYLNNLKVYEVSEKVGYKTSQYFSRIFYQQTGQTPNSCRKPNLLKENE